MATSLHFSDEMEADIKRLAEKHHRSQHGEIIHALTQYVAQQKSDDEASKEFADRFLGKERKNAYNVYKDGDLIAFVQADSADQACNWICQTRWISRLSLLAKQVS